MLIRVRKNVHATCYLLPVTCYLLPVIVKEYWDIKPQAQAEQAMREAMGELTDIRREFKLPLACTT